MKAAFLPNGNSKPTTPIAHSARLRETSDNMKVLLHAIQYNVHQWSICGDLKSGWYVDGWARRLYEVLPLMPLGWSLYSRTLHQA